MENRRGLKVRQMLLTEGMNNAGDGTAYSTSGNQKERVERFVSDVDVVANKNGIGYF
jgi:hypothetical protein